MQTLTKVVPLLHPVPIVLIGTFVKDKLNYTTIGDIAIAGLNPPLVMISLHRDHFSTQGLIEHGKFSINVPDQKMLDVIDFCGMKSGKDFNKGELIRTEVDTDGIPYAQKACISLLCKVEQNVTIETRMIFVARVLNTIVRDDLIVSGQIDFKQLNTITYGLNNHYYSIGEIIGTGYQEGKKKLK